LIGNNATSISNMQLDVDALVKSGVLRDEAIAEIAKQQGLDTTTLSTLIGNNATSISNMQLDVDALVKSGVLRDEAIAEIAKQQGLDTTALSTLIGNNATSIAAIETQVSELETSILARMKEYQDINVDADTALALAIEDIAGDLGTTKDDILEQIGKTEEGLRKDIEEGLTDVETQVSELETSILARMKEYQDINVDADTALALAIEDIAGDLGTTKADILEQIGKTEADLAADIASVSGQVTQLETDILAKMKEYEDAGVARDDALALAIDDVATDLGTTKDDILGQIGKTEEALRKEFASGILDISDQVTQLETDILAKMKEYEDAGVDRDDALALAIDDVATDLGTTKTELLDQIGTSEANILAQFDAGIDELGLDIDAVANFVGKPADQVTEEDIDFVADLIAQQEVLADPTSFVPTEDQLQYDVNNDGVIDINDQNMLAESLSGQEVDLYGDKFNATGLYLYNDQIAAKQKLEAEQQFEQEQQLAKDRQLEMQTQIENTRKAQERERGQEKFARDLALYEPQTRTTQQMGLANIDYLYDIGGSDIFAPTNKTQRFSPYGNSNVVPVQNQNQNPNNVKRVAQGGLLKRNDSLLKLLGEE